MFDVCLSEGPSSLLKGKKAKIIKINIDHWHLWMQCTCYGIVKGRIDTNSSCYFTAKS